MRIGVLGGTFNPVHFAHLQMAEAARDAFALDHVLLMVAADPPHKRVAGAVAGDHRLRMAALAAEPLPRVEASDLELNREGPSFTFDTLMELRACYPGAELFWIVGSDMLLDLPTWHRAGELLRLAKIIAVPRPGQSGADEDAAAYLRHTFGARVLPLAAEVDPVSSTLVRDRVAEALPVTGLVPEAVEQYLYEEGLYLPAAVDAVRRRVRGVLTPKRYRHVMGVVRQAASLCALYGAPRALYPQARLAALLHDCAKQLPPARLAVLAGDDTPGADNVLHAAAGAVLARTAYGVTDDAVLRAIRLHCTGDAGMTLLDMIVYLADLTEPGRVFEGVERYRAHLGDGPEAAMRLAIAGTLGLLASLGVPVHPATLRAEGYFAQLQHTKANTGDTRKEEHG